MTSRREPPAAVARVPAVWRRSWTRRALDPGRPRGRLPDPAVEVASAQVGPVATKEHEGVGLLGAVLHQVPASATTTMVGSVTVRRPAALLGGPIEKAPLTSTSCSATVTVPRSRSTRLRRSPTSPPKRAPQGAGDRLRGPWTRCSTTPAAISSTCTGLSLDPRSIGEFGRFLWRWVVAGHHGTGTGAASADRAGLRGRGDQPGGRRAGEVGWPVFVIIPDLGQLSLGLATTGRLVATVCA
jgi:hypothetical protein